MNSNDATTTAACDPPDGSESDHDSTTDGAFRSSHDPPDDVESGTGRVDQPFDGSSRHLQVSGRRFVIAEDDTRPAGPGSGQISTDVIVVEDDSVTVVQGHRNPVDAETRPREIDDFEEDSFCDVAREELTLDEAEDDSPLPKRQTTAAAAEDDEEIESSCGRRCRRRCCDGPRSCWRRFDVELREAYGEMKDHIAAARRRHPLDRNCLLSTLRKKFPILQWLPKYKLVLQRNMFRLCITATIFSGRLAFAVSIAAQYV